MIPSPPQLRTPRRATGPVACALVAALACLSWLQPADAAPVEGGEPNDLLIKLKTQTALLGARDLNARNVLVDVVDGAVRVAGVVGSEADLARVQQIAASIADVGSVDLDVDVVAPAALPQRPPKPGQLSDEFIADALAPRLRPFAHDEHRIEVVEVSDGVVVLGGSAARIVEALDAIRTAYASPGVRFVESRIRVPQGWSEAEVDTVAPAPAAAASPAPGDTSVLGGAVDLALTAAVKLALLADPDVPALDVNVDVQDEVATLFGIVGGQDARREAARVARETPGVNAVHNLLQVVAPAAAAQVELRDEVIAQRVRDALAEKPSLRDDPIEVAVAAGFVRLTGQADGVVEQMRAATTARRVPGVRAVRADIEVPAPTSRRTR